ncbi:uncharacterized protein ISCGN_014519 [Ixodes scapularis]
MAQDTKATSELIVPVNFVTEWRTPAGLDVKVDTVQTRFDTFRIVDDCADLDQEWVDFARDHPDCAEAGGDGLMMAFLDPEFEAFRKLPEGGFGVHLDLGCYRPEGVTVKVREGSVLVTASDQERTSVDVEGVASKKWRKFERRFKLPEGVMPECVATELRPDGWLKISAPVQELGRRSSAPGRTTGRSWSGSEGTGIETDDSKSSIVDR